MKNKKLLHSEILDIQIKLLKYFDNNAISVLEKKIIKQLKNL